MEHLVNDPGFAEESSSSNTSNNSSDVESLSNSSESEKSAECQILTPTVDRFKKRTYQSISLDSFVIKQPKTSSTSSPSTYRFIDQHELLSSGGDELLSSGGERARNQTLQSVLNEF